MAIQTCINCYNFIFDHNSLSWAQDDALNVYSNSLSPKPENTTFSYNISAEGLYPHATGAILGASTNELGLGMTDIDTHTII